MIYNETTLFLANRNKKQYRCINEEKRNNMASVLEETKFLMKKYGISANKNLGQNFLIDDEIVKKIIQSADITKADMVIEIGPGLGTLTSKLLEVAGKVIAIELDDRMITVLQDRFSLYDNFELLHEDVLKVDLNKLIAKNSNSIGHVKIVANLPYYITTPIIMKLLEEKLLIDSITVMVQKEVADRITEIPGEKNSGAITYTVYYYAEPREVCFVSKDCFIPSPEVNSEVIKLLIRKNPAVKVKEELLFFKVIKASFLQRRKTLLNGLLNGGMIQSKEEGKTILQKLNLPEDIRGEKLTIEQFGIITDELAMRK